MSKEISPIIIAAVDLMKQVNDGLEVEFIGEMMRTEPSEHYPIGKLGIPIKMTWFDLEENVFLECELCEAMLTPFGHLVAEQLIMEKFRDKFNIYTNRIK
jgi:hypothetical protein